MPQTQSVHDDLLQQLGLGRLDALENQWLPFRGAVDAHGEVELVGGRVLQEGVPDAEDRVGRAGLCTRKG